MSKSVFLLALAIVASTAIAVTVVMVMPLAHNGDDGEVITTSGCAQRYFNLTNSFVCVCNSSHCDRTPHHVTSSLPVGVAHVVTSTSHSERFNPSRGQFVQEDDVLRPPREKIVINTGVTYQTIKGFGAAFTDAAAINWHQLSQATRDHFVTSYYSPQGLEYNIGRIPMAACDFSERIYTYDDVADDFKLEQFALAEEDLNYKIPLIARAKQLTARPISFFASPWSAPAWMKTTGNVVGGQLRPEPEYRQAWADYFVRFIEEYGKHDIVIWAVTAQNEPDIGMRPDFPFQCMGYTPEEMREFVKTYLGPTLRDRGHGDVKIIIGDDQRLLLPDWAGVILNDTDANKFVSGIGIHWYTNMIASVAKLDQTHEQFPGKFIMGTEACSGSVPFLEPKVDLGSWQRGEYYSVDILNNLNHWAVGWTDWNMALNMQGGPNWVKNFVDAPIIVNGEKDEFYKQPMYYHMGHFSKFIEEGSVRVEVSRDAQKRKFKFTALLNPQRDAVVFIVLNQNEEPVTKLLIHPPVGHMEITVPAQSIQTYVWRFKE